MNTEMGSFLGRVRPPHVQAWQPTLVRASAPRWGAEDREAVGLMLEAYRARLLATPHALATLESSAIATAAIDALGLGFADRKVGLALPKGDTYEGAQLRGRLQRVGLLRASGHGHLNGALVAPVVDARGRVVDVYGRKITPKLRSGSAYHLSLYDPPQGVFNLAGIARSDEAVICNDLLDALAFWSAGVRNVTTTVGPRGFTDGHLRALAAFEVKRVVVAFSTNPIEDRYARMVAQALDAAGIECRRMCLPRDVGGTGAALHELVRAATPYRFQAGKLVEEAGR